MRSGRADRPEALEFLAERSGGDARTALNALELACEAAGPDGEPVTLEHAEDAMQRRAILYDRQADRHYDTISAWIKATRGSDPDASLYYLAVMLEGGEDPRFIVRRMVVLASEDIGNADPQALSVATAAAAAVEHVGMPECQFALAQAAIYLSLAPEVRRGQARRVRRPRSYIRERGADAPPAYLRSSTRSDGGYDNPHRRPGHISPQELMPDRAIGAAVLRARRRRGGAPRARLDRDPPGARPGLSARRSLGRCRDAMDTASRQQLESFNPATGERLGAVPITPPGGRAGGRRRGRRGAAVLGAADARTTAAATSSAPPRC